MQSTKKPMTSGEFRNYQYNEVKKAAFVMANIVTIVAVTLMIFVGSDKLLHFWYAVGPHMAAFTCFLCLTFALSLWLVYFAAKEQANNKLWIPNDTSQPIDYKTKGVTK